MATTHVLYPYGQFAIVLPADHGLPTYQAVHPRYDRFLPHLARYLPAAATVIDVGANVGDTLAAMVAENPQLAFLCIEPDGEFFDLLNVNAARIRAWQPGLQVRTVKALVGQAVAGATLEGDKGTKKAVFGKEGAGVASRSLDAICDEAAPGPVALLKSDVDGFDYDVLDSASRLLAGHAPLLFFECQQDHDFQHAGYAATLQRLQQAGYRDWVAFDNYGELMLRSADANEMVQLLQYVWRQNLRRSTRTMYYLDLLAATPRDRALLDRATADYVAADWRSPRPAGAGA